MFGNIITISILIPAYYIDIEILREVIYHH